LAYLYYIGLRIVMGAVVLAELIIMAAQLFRPY